MKHQKQSNMVLMSGHVKGSRENIVKSSARVLFVCNAYGIITFILNATPFPRQVKTLTNDYIL